MVTFLNQTTIFKWGVIECECKNVHKTRPCLKEFGLRAQDIVTIQGSKVNIIMGGGGRGDVIDHLIALSSSLFYYEQNFHVTPKIMRRMATNMNWIWKPSHSKCVIFKLQEMILKWPCITHLPYASRNIIEVAKPS